MLCIFGGKECVYYNCSLDEFSYTSQYYFQLGSHKNTVFFWWPGLRTKEGWGQGAATYIKQRLFFQGKENKCPN